MNYSWKLYRKRFTEGLTDAQARESMFVLGVDLGNHSSVVAYYDINRGTTEIIDVSGGYGKPSMPTALQYVRESREWVYGEYALLNRGLTADTLYTGLLEKLPKKEYVDVDGKPQPVEAVLGVFLKELVASCKSINPKAEIAGVTLAAPSYTADETKNALTQVFKAAGYEKSLIGLDTDRECIFTRYFQQRPVKPETVALLDFGARELRGGIYEIVPGESKDDAVRIVSVSSLFDKAFGTDGVDHHVESVLTDFYCAETKTPYGRLERRIEEQIKAFAYQHKDLLFQQSLAARPVKLYYNFVYPPIVYTVTEKIMEAFIKPYREGFLGFLERLFSKAIADKGKPRVDAVICTGGGFEMLWARNAVASFFEDAEIVTIKNPKGAVAEGASLRSAKQLGILSGVDFRIEDIHMLKVDLGVNISVKSRDDKRGRFYPIVERNSFWWQEHEPVSFIYSGGTGERAESIALYSRSEDGELRRLGEIPMDGLPPRPPGATRLNLWLEFSSYNVLTATVRDMGFGEMFPFTDFSRKVEVRL